MLDIASIPLENFSARNPDFPKEQLVHQDFFDHDRTYDLILEQTFFCAISPDLRSQYAKKMYSLLNQNGRLAGLWFSFPLDTHGGPPYGGSLEEYLTYFTPYFEIITFGPSYNSISPRQGNELFAIMRRK